MSLISCSECNKKVSDKADACPHCGAPTNLGKKKYRSQVKKDRVKRRSNVQGAGCLTIIVAIVLGMTFIGAPFAVPVGIVGAIILVLGLLPIW